MNVTLLIWGHVSFLLGVSGNLLVLYGTIFHNAIKLDEISKWIIKNLAFVDLCNCIFVVVPDIANQYSNGRWVFGSCLCYINAINQYTFMIANVNLITFLSINKLLRCVYPLRNFSPSRLQKGSVTLVAFLICLVPMIWIVIALSRNLLQITENGNEIVVRVCRAYFKQTQEVSTARIVGFAVTAMSIGLPNIILTVTTAVLLVYAVRKTNRPINKKNVLITVSVTVIFLLSFFPLMLYMTAHMFPDTIEGAFLYPIFEWVWSFTFLSTWSNPIIYLVTNESFRVFIKGAICAQKFISRVSVSSQNQPSMQMHDQNNARLNIRERPIALQLTFNSSIKNAAQE